MLLQTMPSIETSVETVLRDFVTGILQAIPKIIAGLVFLFVAYLGIKLILSIVRNAIDRSYPEEQELIADLTVLVVGIFLWFGVLLALLRIIGMGDIAASLGTATGFIGLGIAYALKEMIADTVAGVYLLRDPDFNVGDAVNTASVTGTITRIDLRKTRIQDESGELVVIANRDVEKKWTRKSGNHTIE